MGKIMPMHRKDTINPSAVGQGIEKGLVRREVLETLGGVANLAHDGIFT
jgi:hypothetical protein